MRDHAASDPGAYMITATPARQTSYTHDVVTVGPVAVGAHAPGQRIGHEDPSVGREDPTELRVGLQGRDEPVDAECDDAETDPDPAAVLADALPPATPRRSRTGRRRGTGRPSGQSARTGSLLRAVVGQCGHERFATLGRTCGQHDPPAGELQVEGEERAALLFGHDQAAPPRPCSRAFVWKTAHERLRIWTADDTWERVLDQVTVQDDSIGNVDGRSASTPGRPGPPARCWGPEEGGCTTAAGSRTSPSTESPGSVPQGTDQQNLPAVVFVVVIWTVLHSLAPRAAAPLPTCAARGRSGQIEKRS